VEGRASQLTDAVEGLVIRFARTDEVDVLAEIERVAGEMFRDVGLDVIADDPEPPAGMYLAAIGMDAIWVAELDGKMVGYTWVEDLGGPDDPAPHLEQVSVRPECGGRGIGTALVEEAVAWARRVGGQALTLTTFRDVPFNGPWYERRGFRVVPDDQLDPRLRAVRAHEAERGIDVAPRVVMRRPVDRA